MKIYRKIKIAFMLVIILAISANYILADDILAGGQGGAFLRIPVGSRPAGMGNAFTAISNDASAPFFNAAGLSQISGTRISAMYNIMSLDRMNYQASLIFGGMNNLTMALTFNNFGVDDIIECLPGEEPSGDTFGANDMAIGFSAGMKILPILSIGGGAKYIMQAIDDKNGTGFDFDVGAMFMAPFSLGLVKNIRAGASLNNLGGTIVWDTDSDHEDEILPTLRLGASANIPLAVVDITVAADMSQNMVDDADKDNNAKLHLGAEGWFNHMFAVRAGLDNEDLTMGASIKLSDFRFDYAFIPDFLDEGETHKFAVEMKL